MLRERIPDFDPAVCELGENVVPRVKPPVVVSFRPEASLSEVVAAVRNNRSILLEAAPGAGKSTRVPRELAKELGCLVVHVLPNERLASQLSGYLGGEVQFLVDVQQPFPRVGVVLISAACLVARWLAAGEATLPPCVLFHDESHESDAYTYVVKTLAPTLGSVSCYVSATATSGADGFRTLEARGRLIRGTYTGAATAWDPYDEGKPWGVASLRDNALLFTDSRSLTAQLQDSYASAGFQVVRFHSRMTLAAFERAMTLLSDQSSSLMVAIADSSHRSGFTFPVGTIVDSGKIGFLDTSTGRPVRRERGLYALEAFQTAARGARMPGQSTSYYVPEGVSPPSMVCDLDPVEVEAAALVFRFLGYRPPREFKDCVMYDGKVPRELCVALQSDQPLALIRPDALVGIAELAVPSGRRSPFLAQTVVETNDGLDVRNSAVSADTAREVGQSGITGGSDWDVDWHKGLEHLLSEPESAEELELGRAYYATGLETDVAVSVMFPDGADSVLRYMQGGALTKSYLSLASWQRSIAVNLLMPRQAALAAEMDGIRRVVQSVRGSGVSRSAFAKRLAVQVVERLSTVSAEANQVNAALQRLGRGFCAFHEMEINIALSEDVYRSWMDAWETLPGASNQARLQAENAVRREGARAFGSVWSGTKSRLVGDNFVPMAARGSGMRAIGALISPPSSNGRSSHASSTGDQRCEGSPKWYTSVRRRSDGRLERYRKMACDVCGVGASRRTHGT